MCNMTWTNGLQIKVGVTYSVLVQVLEFGNLAARDPRVEFFPSEGDYIAAHSQIIQFSVTSYCSSLLLCCW